MIVTNTIENWYASGGLTSVVLICCTIDLQLWHVVWMKIKEFLDKARPVAKNWFKMICTDLGPQLDYTKLHKISRRGSHCEMCGREFDGTR